jgi:hypothetical protein
MTIGSSLFLIAIGAILRWAVTAEVAGIDINVVGLILLVVGAVGLVLGLFLWISAREDREHYTAPPPPRGTV